MSKPETVSQGWWVNVARRDGLKERVTELRGRLEALTEVLGELVVILDRRSIPEVQELAERITARTLATDEQLTHAEDALERVLNFAGPSRSEDDAT